MRSQTWRSLRSDSHARQVHRAHAPERRHRRLALPLALHPRREILDRATEELGELEPIEKDDPAAPADEFRFDGALGTFGVITPVSEPFCARCSRLRLTADGKIHPCLLTDLDVPVKDAIRSEDPIPAIHKFFGRRRE